MTTTNNTMPEVIYINKSPNQGWSDSADEINRPVEYTRTDLLEQRAKVAADKVFGNYCLGFHPSHKDTLAAIITEALKGETK